MGDELKPLAMYFSMKCPEKYDRKAFPDLWEEYVEKKDCGSRDRAMTRLEFMAKSDNPGSAEKAKKLSITSLIWKLVYDTTIEGLFEHAHVAKLLHRMGRHKICHG